MDSRLDGPQDNHVASDTIPISGSTWAAFERAVSRSVGRSGEHDAVAAAEVVKSGVRQVVDGRTPRLGGRESAPLATRALDRVRRHFIEEIGAGDASDAQEGIHILSALGRVQHLLDARSRRHVSAASSTERVERDGLHVMEEVAHDMRSPLASILFLLDMLSSGRTGPLTDQQQRQLRLIYGASLGLMQLACDLIDSGRIEERFREESAGTLSIPELFRDVVDVVQPVAEERSVSIVVVSPITDERRGIAAALHRILLNLAINAIKFTRDGTVTLEARPLRGTRIEFAVQDSGREIPAPVLTQLFDPFRHQPSRNRTFSSSGLGLSICHKLVAALGGELCVRTSPTCGTRFYFALDLPLADESAPQASSRELVTPKNPRH